MKFKPEANMADTDLFLQLDQRVDRSPTAPKKRPSPRERSSHRPQPAQTPPPPRFSIAEQQPDLPHTAMKPTDPHVPHDVTTSFLHDVNLRNWRDVIENTETQNSALRLTSAERYAVEDVISELRRKEKIKTSMNEIARLGLLLLIHDFQQHRKNSVVYQVKKS
jgi:hypothetical protein